MSRDPDVPRLPRGRGLKLTSPQIFKIIFFAALLVAIIVLQRPCSDAAGKFVGQFDNTAKVPPDAATKWMTEEELRKALEEQSRPAAPQ